MSFAANYAGSCGACEGGIRPGDRVKYVDDVLVHVGCSDDVVVRGVGPREVVCGECFIVKPCRCEDGQ